MTALTSTVLACSLKPLDIAFMKAAHYKVNIVPVIAKADTLTKLEVQKLKKKVLIRLYLLARLHSNSFNRRAATLYVKGVRVLEYVELSSLNCRILKYSAVLLIHALLIQMCDYGSC